MKNMKELMRRKTPAAQKDQEIQENQEAQEDQEAQEQKTAKRTPNLEQLEAELRREKYKSRYRNVLRSTIFTLVTVAAAAVLVATLLTPVLQITGESMTPTLCSGEIVVSLKGSGYETGDVIAFYYDNKILVKRVIAQAGQWVDIDEDGNVYVDGELIEEPYLQERAFGECNIELPYQVPATKIFVMGDHRSVSLDSRNTAVGCVGEDQIVGRLLLRVWPLNTFSIL